MRKKTKEKIPKNLRFVKGVMDSNNHLPLNFNMETLQESKITKVISTKLVRKAIEILHKLVEKEKPKKDKDDNSYDETKEVEINEVAETDKEELLFDDKNDNPTPQDAMTTATAAATDEDGNDNDVGTKDGSGEDEADDTKEGGVPWSKTAITTTTKRA